MTLVMPERVGEVELDVAETVDTAEEPTKYVVFLETKDTYRHNFEASYHVLVSPNAGYWNVSHFDTLNSVLVYRPFSTAHLSYAPNGEGALMDRLTKLGELSDGWLGAGSTAPDPFVLDWLRTHPALVTESPNRISVLPLSDGGVALQWTIGEDEFIAEIHSNKTIHLLADRVSDDSFEEQTIPLAGNPLSAFIATGHVA